MRIGECGPCRTIPTPRVGAVRTSSMCTQRAKEQRWMGLSMRIGRNKVRGPRSEVRGPKNGARSSRSDVRGLGLVLRTSDLGLRTRSNGFTLIELMVVITIILILAT